MLRLTLRGMGARRLRTALTAAAVVIGVSLISGTFILTDTIDRSFDNIFTTASKGFDVSISPHEAVKQDFQDPPPMPQSLVTKVKSVDGVARVEGSVFSRAVIYDKSGKRLSTQAPNFVTNAGTKPFDPFDYVEGHAPRAEGEVAIDRHTASAKDFKLGDSLRVSGEGPQQRFRIVGIAKYGNVDSLAGASVAVLTLPEAQRVAGKVSELDGISVISKPGVTPSQLRSRLRATLPRSVTVRTAKQQAASQASDVKSNFGFIKTALLAFAGIALFVGGFMIFNTFTITVAQRMREFAMLRTLGASRRQVLRAVVLEALLVGFGAAALGVLAGLALAPALNELFKAIGASLPQEGTVFKPRTAVVGLLVGTLVTVVSSLLPALRATRVPPIAALHEGAVLPQGRVGRRRTPIAAAIALLGAAVLAYGAFGASGSEVAPALGGGAAAVFIGVGMLSSRLVRPLASVVGRPLERLRGVAGRLARENAVRNTGRTASTAAALMIGVALVSFVTIFAAGARSSVGQAVDQVFHSDLVLKDTSGFNPFPDKAGQAVGNVPGVAYSSPLRFAKGKVKGIRSAASFDGIDPATAPQVFRLKWASGSQSTLARLGSHDAVADKSWASSHHIAVGDSISVTTPRDRTVTLKVRGLFSDRLNFGGDAVIAVQTIAQEFGVQEDQYGLVKLRPGTDQAAVKKRVDQLLKNRFPNVEARTIKQFKDDQSEKINQLLGLIYVLLSLSVIVSLFGIVNTLALSIHERTRELGMLRAIGTSRRQVRRIVRYESVITALIGAVLGSVLGVCFAVIVSRPLGKDGFTLSFPVATLFLLLVLAALAGVLAAIGPARRAARLDVLEALAYE